MIASCTCILADRLSDVGKSFVSLCMQREAKARPDITALLLHPFVARVPLSSRALIPGSPEHVFFYSLRPVSVGSMPESGADAELAKPLTLLNVTEHRRATSSTTATSALSPASDVEAPYPPPSPTIKVPSVLGLRPGQSVAAGSGPSAVRQRSSSLSSQSLLLSPVTQQVSIPPTDVSPTSGLQFPLMSPPGGSTADGAPSVGTPIAKGSPIKLSLGSIPDSPLLSPQQDLMSLKNKRGSRSLARLPDRKKSLETPDSALNSSKKLSPPTHPSRQFDASSFVSPMRSPTLSIDMSFGLEIGSPPMSSSRIPRPKELAPLQRERDPARMARYKKLVVDSSATPANPNESFFGQPPASKASPACSKSPVFSCRPVGPPSSCSGQRSPQFHATDDADPVAAKPVLTSRSKSSGRLGDAKLPSLVNPQ